MLYSNNRISMECECVLFLFILILIIIFLLELLLTNAPLFATPNSNPILYYHSLLLLFIF